ncbi:MAG TPA: MBL fold metallo-hydrolase [Solirubrobacteraceae bacterium]|jgi:glyoxylase-like metal-dependent hydrolase (beta-lactamase superfamily II)|nr:MBL fold metallo-hydrolase [Solirubrobacteraceae bacterium]
MPRQRELGRGERVLPGLWRLRLPLPWPGIPHCNAWALAAGSGLVLVDTGAHEPGSLAHLELALHQVHLRLEHVTLVACTHAHADHYGQAAPIVERAGCPLWLHPSHEHAMRPLRDPEQALSERIEIARQSGVPEVALALYAERAKESPSGVAGWRQPERDLVTGVEIETDLGPFTVYETPGHAPSHVCLFQPERRLLISGDHLLGRISLYYDYGWTPDPVGEFLRSLDVVESLDARLCVAGHGRPFTDVGAHIEANRKLVRERLDAVAAALQGGPRTVVEIVPGVYGEPLTQVNAAWRLSETLCYLRHLEVEARVAREGGEAPAGERWTVT